MTGVAEWFADLLFLLAVAAGAAIAGSFFDDEVGHMRGLVQA